MKILYCKHCQKIIEVLNSSACDTFCCNEAMAELIPNTVDAAVEKHIPVVEQNVDEVMIIVGSVEHPMDENHYIMWIYVVTNKGRYRFDLNPGDKPVANMKLQANENIIETYAYCNLHGLWVNK